MRWLYSLTVGTARVEKFHHVEAMLRVDATVDDEALRRVLTVLRGLS